MIIIRRATIAFGQQNLFCDVSLTLSNKDKVGLFGLNGAGKSTLLKAIAGHVALDQGSITIDPSFTVAYMPQEVVLQSDRSIIDETLSADIEWWNAFQAVEQAKSALAFNPDNHELIQRYEKAYQEFFMYDPHHKRTEALKILAGLGFDTAAVDKPVASLSTGWKMRVVLAQLLFKKADFYLFDEPTNHLDIVAKEWFLRFLKNNGVGFLMVCHEKNFLNQLCSKICAIENGIATLYQGNYDAYVKQRDERFLTLHDQYIVQQKEIEQMEKTIARFRASASKASLAQSMIKKLAKIERIVLPSMPSKPNFSFPLFDKSARNVVSVSDLAFSYKERVIFHSISFTLERGQKLAIVAPNGAGKTTLIRLIQGILQPQKGTVVWGDGVKKAFFDQDQVASLALDKTVFENAYAASLNQTTQAIRTLLGNFLFKGDDVQKKAGVLSGGERNRLGMVRVLLQQANTLILDEPTNHLDIPSKDILCQALQRFEGTLLFVSHDQDFINQVATHVLELQCNRAILFTGNYDDYLLCKSSIKDENQQSTAFVNIKSIESEKNKKNSIKVEKNNDQEIKKCEQRIAKLEKEIEQLSAQFADFEYGTFEFDQACTQLKKLEKERNSMIVEWESLIS